MLVKTYKIVSSKNKYTLTTAQRGDRTCVSGDILQTVALDLQFDTHSALLMAGPPDEAGQQSGRKGQLLLYGLNRLHYG